MINLIGNALTSKDFKFETERGKCFDTTRFGFIFIPLFPLEDLHIFEYKGFNLYIIGNEKFKCIPLKRNWNRILRIYSISAILTGIIFLFYLPLLGIILIGVGFFGYGVGKGKHSKEIAFQRVIREVFYEFTGLYVDPFYLQADFLMEFISLIAENIGFEKSHLLNYSILNEIAHEYFKSGKYKEAVFFSRISFALNPDISQNHASLRILYNTFISLEKIEPAKMLIEKYPEILRTVKEKEEIKEVEKFTSEDPEKVFKNYLREFHPDRFTDTKIKEDLNEFIKILTRDFEKLDPQTFIKKYSKINFNLIEILFYMSIEYKKTNKRKKEQQTLEKILEINPYYLNALINLSAIYLEGAKYTDAEEILEKAKRVYPSEFSILWNLALSKYHLGKMEESKILLNKILKYEKDQKKVEKVLRLIEKLKNR